MLLSAEFVWKGYFASFHDHYNAPWFEILAVPRSSEEERGGSDVSQLWAWVDIGGIRELSGLVRLLPVVVEKVPLFAQMSAMHRISRARASCL
mgnify:CR=1 FL=1